MNPKINEIVIDGTTYVPKGSEVKVEYTGDAKIVVLQRGWVYVGRFERNGNDCKLHNAYNIRVWGTTKGLPELVNGVTKDTKLDKCEGVVEFDWLTVVCSITVNIEKWNVLL
jgi:hypothetical protein